MRRQEPLPDVLAHLSDLVQHVTDDGVPSLLGAVEHVRAQLWVRLLIRRETDATEELLGVAEAAALLRTTTDWLYRHANQLPFTVRLGPRQLRFSKRGIDRYIKTARR